MICCSGDEYIDEEARRGRESDEEDDSSRGRLNKKGINGGPSPKTANKNRGIKELMGRVNSQSEQI